ncbi:MAG: hypothetical protein QMD71_08355 [bacterium]|nr:hypothetical protein [bacterium]
MGRHKYKKVSCLLPLLLLLGCKQSSLLFRAGADYFPLKPENTWVYLHTSYSDKDTITLKVIKNEVIGTRECWLLERNGYPEYWWKDENRVDKFYLQTIFVNGEEDTIASFWLTWLELPFVLGNLWSYMFKEQSYIIGDTIKVDVQVKGEVLDLDGNDYKVRVELIEHQESMEFGTSCDTITCYEWYRPNIGVIKRVIDGVEEKLISYEL